jgi:hypothetical protein
MFRDTDLAWAAGIIDGEGCISLNQEKRTQYLLRLTVTNTNLLLLTRIQELFGGNICPMKRYQDHWKDRWQWDLKAAKAERALRAVLPYLVAKRQEADIALQARALIGKVGSTHNPNREQLAWLKHELSGLKGHRRKPAAAPLDEKSVDA